ncbi:cyanobacterial porin [Halothece sp. PCC 7418]|uniref:iron uptake porin n=1 Tax=Halothece sp. (strain PCC 7418) TaxID=65093 RepID=UPI0002A08059|nr:iron uptake porin [Halothece sp. PCC 7418]AFZ45877.1 cyanobacterial porin [Halothece sp. PCC 7418]
MYRYSLLLLTLTISLFPKPLQAQPNSNLSTPVTPVTELKDVSPTHWAFSALKQLQERYQCIAGYPDQTFRGEQPVSRYEFSALLNACITQLEASIREEEQSIIQRLQTEFARELSILRGRVDGATARVRELELTQFSTTTKLQGVVNFALSNSSQSGEETGVVLQARSRLHFKTSFTGRDLLSTRLTVGNSTTPNLANDTSEVTQTHQWQGNTENQLLLSKLSYQFPISDNTQAVLTAQGGEHADYHSPVNPFFEDDNAGTTTLSTFAQRNPILSLGGGSGLALSHAFNDTLYLGIGYYSPDAQNPEAGLTNGTYSTGMGLKWDATDDLSLGLNYLHSYFQQGDFGFTDSLSEPTPIVGTAVVNNTLAAFPTVTNAYGVEILWQANAKLAFSGRLGYTDVKALGEGEGEIWNYAVSVIFPDLGQTNNLGGIIVGAQPYLGYLEGDASFKNDIPWHLEGFYKWQVSDHVSLTPGIIWHLNPNQDQTEADILTSTMRMTVTF